MPGIGGAARRAALGMLAAATLAPAAGAEGYNVVDLGWVANRETCMIRGENVLYRYRGNYGGGSVMRSDWVIYGWDMRPGDQDVVIMCPVVSGTINAFLVVHGEDTESRRVFTMDEVRRLWSQ